MEEFPKSGGAHLSKPGLKSSFFMSSAVTKVTLEQCQAKVTEIDADGDGLISKTELQMREYVRDTMMIG